MKHWQYAMKFEHARRGFTLVEVVMSMAIMAILMAVMTSIIMMASHALPDQDTLLDPRAAAVDVMEMAGELYSRTTTCLVGKRTVAVVGDDHPDMSWTLHCRATLHLDALQGG
jgi:prepilin-type N-terminal cleavage/methylation domain-containing protein